MKKFLFALMLAISIPFTAAAAAADERNLPLIQEEVDEIIIIQITNSSHHRIVFIRNNSILATRLMIDDMLWTTSGDKFQLIWEDYWTAERIVETKKLSILRLEQDPTQVGQDCAWWGMFRNMRDLKNP